ncbi:hypothetical protein [Cellulomonas aerilata]|nr:hypothetical protein [Cellulomonas aerilata]
MIIDCDSCTVRGAACTDCVVTFLTIPVRPAGRPGPPTSASAAAHRHAPASAAGRPVDLDDDERAAIDVLASSGLVPPLRMVRAM